MNLLPTSASSITVRDTYYYATRYKLNDQDYVYGGFSSGTGGFWDGTNNISGILTVGRILIAVYLTVLFLLIPPFPPQPAGDYLL